MYLKRFFWWFGAKSLFVLAKTLAPVWHFIGFLHYKGDYLLKKLVGFAGLDGQLVKGQSAGDCVYYFIGGGPTPN